MLGKTNCKCNVLYVCNTASATEIKEIESDLQDVGIGKLIYIKFTNANTFGAYNANHIVTNGVKLSLNGNVFPVKVAGENAGVGFVNANDVHAFIFDGTNWNDITSDVIYHDSAEIKFRSGAYFNFNGTTLTLTY